MRINRRNLLFLFLLVSVSAFSQIKAIWVPVWDFSTAEKIDEVIEIVINMGLPIL